ncbi:hypothetical protein BD289DRAFT_126510 [Coniella lustricola]|uniref:Uncharacterized protein n=1 Tax=Coniella lustricola TaxID=2025994 RepID=A0A2T3AFZ1_9PEZI|nr:hypothetical protein BD289DRAFT_126510 [Coniella lustricola]
MDGENSQPLTSTPWLLIPHKTPFVDIVKSQSIPSTWYMSEDIHCSHTTHIYGDFGPTHQIQACHQTERKPSWKSGRNMGQRAMDNISNGQMYGQIIDEYKICYHLGHPFRCYVFSMGLLPFAVLGFYRVAGVNRYLVRLAQDTCVKSVSPACLIH